MRLLFSIGMPNFVLPNLDSVNHCASKYLFISILISLTINAHGGSRDKWGEDLHQKAGKAAAGC